MANMAGADNPMFDAVLRKVLVIVTEEYGERDR
jgi:hypothetical protein